MTAALGFHITKTTYGTWLPGDARGSWLKDWSPKQGYGVVHRLSDADPRREAMAQRQMRHPPCRLSDAMIGIVVECLVDCVCKSQGGLLIMAAAIEPTHVHLLLPNTGRPIPARPSGSPIKPRRRFTATRPTLVRCGPASHGASKLTTWNIGSGYFPI